MNVKKAFAKIDEAEMVALPDADVSKFVGAATVIAPVPAHAPPVEQAVLSLRRGKTDHLWIYVNGNGDLVFAVARWNDAAGKKVSFSRSRGCATPTDQKGSPSNIKSHP